MTKNQHYPEEFKIEAVKQITGVVVLFVQIGALWLEAQYPCGFTAVATPGR